MNLPDLRKTAVIFSFTQLKQNLLTFGFYFFRKLYLISRCNFVYM